MEKLKLIEDQIQKNGSNDDDKLHPNLLEIKRILKDNEFYDDFIDKIIDAIKNNLTYSSIDNKMDVHRFVYDYIKDKLIISDGFKINKKNKKKDKNEKDEKPEKKIIVLVGPTGVGKTTTIAKIAANAIREKLKVS